ncbi:MAG: hypothetical protein BGO67_02995 [Alphaproteobacteria bacterium 41-28]|nr:MAG: hypothetical protein BGO67_02995 [Alphaproteobacteria bacterium 41-28]
MSAHHLKYNKIFRRYLNRFAVIPLVSLSFLFNFASSTDVEAASGKTTVKKAKRLKRTSLRRSRGARTKRTSLRRSRGARSKRASLRRSRGARSKRAMLRSKRIQSKKTSTVLAPSLTMAPVPVIEPIQISASISEPVLISSATPVVEGVSAQASALPSSAATSVVEGAQASVLPSSAATPVVEGAPASVLPSSATPVAEGALRQTSVVQTEDSAASSVTSLLAPLNLSEENTQLVVLEEQPSSDLEGASLHQVSLAQVNSQTESSLVAGVPSAPPPPPPPPPIDLTITYRVEGERDALAEETATPSVVNGNTVEEGNNLVEALAARRLGIEDDSDEEGFDTEDEGFDSEDEFNNEDEKKSRKLSENKVNIQVDLSEREEDSAEPAFGAETSAFGVASEPMEEAGLIAPPSAPPPPPLASSDVLPKSEEVGGQLNNVSTGEVETHPVITDNYALEIESSKERNQELEALIESQKTIMKSSNKTSKKYKMAKQRKLDLKQEKKDLEKKLHELEKAEKQKKQEAAKGVLGKLKKLAGGDWLGSIKEGKFTLKKNNNQENSEGKTALEEEKSEGWMSKISRMISKKKEEKLKKKEEKKKKIESLKRKKTDDEESSEFPKNKRRSINSGEYSTDAWDTGEFSSGEWKVR